MFIHESILSTATKPRLHLVAVIDDEKELLLTLGPVRTAVTGVLCLCSLTNKYYILLEAVEK